MSAAHKIIKNKDGAVAVEFAIIASVLILTVLFILTVGLIIYFNLALDFATSKAGRQIMTGTVQKNAMTQQQFASSVLCPYLPTAMNCNDVIINVYSVTEAPSPQGYYPFANSGTTALTAAPLSNANATFSPGSQKSYEYIQVEYPVMVLPGIISSLIGGGATYNGKPTFVITSTAAFRNEQY